MTSLPEPNIEMLGQRAELLRELREFFDSRGFLEVQPPCLSRDCVIDATIDPIRVNSDQLRVPHDLPAQLYLQTSPELSMKRMLVAGSPSIYSIGPVFRSGESGDLHNVEFTMLEWYALGADGQAGIEILGELATQVLSSDGYDVCSYRRLFRDALDLDPLEAPIESLRRQAESIDRRLAESLGDDRDALLDVLLSQTIQPTLGLERPLVVRNYPLSQAALARTAPDDPDCAARFELFVNGVEVANGYDELTDVDVLIERANQANLKRIAAGRMTLRVESSLVEAMRRGLPPCSGVALGVDRLLMTRHGEKSISKAMPFRIESS